MWIDSKTAAGVFGVKYDALVKSVKRAEKQGKKFCTINGKILPFKHINGSRGGSSGKVLQIWLDDELVIDAIKRGAIADEVIKAKLLSMLNMRGISCNDTPISDSSLRDIKESRVKNEYNDTKSNFNSDGGSCNAALDRDFKSYSDMDSAPNGNSFKNSTHCRLRDSNNTKFQGDKYVGYKDRAKTDTCGTGDGFDDLGGANSFMDDAWGVDSCANSSSSIMARIPDDNGFKSIKEELYEDLGDDRDSRDNSVHSTHNIRSCTNAKSINSEDTTPRNYKENSDIEALFNDLSVDDSKKADAILKAKIVKMWLKAKESKGVKIDAFLSYININKMYDKRVSKGQLYDWCKKYSIGGIHGLVDERGGNKPTLIESMGMSDKVDELILSSKGKINAYNIYNRLHHSFVNQGLLTHEEFIRKEKEIIPYISLNRYVNRWKKEHPTEVLYIEKGYDAAINSKLAAVGDASWSAKQVNEYVEIDATTLDVFAKKIDLDLAKAIYEMDKSKFASFEECCDNVSQNQKRYTVVGLIDKYSGVCSYMIGKSENIHTVKRAIAKYIAKFGVPQTIIGDNGKAFKSHEMARTFESLDIEYRAVRAYSGWLKPYIERSWRAFQDNFSVNLAGFIGHSVEQRQAIEFGFSKMERRLKKGQKTNLKEMLLIKDLEDLIDRYVDGFINARWIDRLGSTPNDVFKRDGLHVKRLSALAVNARLGQLISKKVYKKGIMHDNSYFINSKIYAYDEVKIVANLNNSDEIYIWSCDGEFIGVGVRFDDRLGVSAEIAREARNYSKRKIDNARAKANEAAKINQDSFVEYVQSVSIDSSAAVEYADEQGAVIALEHKRAKSLKAMSVNLMPTKPKPKKKEYNWEDLA